MSTAGEPKITRADIEAKFRADPGRRRDGRRVRPRHRQGRRDRGRRSSRSGSSTSWVGATAARSARSSRSSGSDPVLSLAPPLGVAVVLPQLEAQPAAREHHHGGAHPGAPDRQREARDRLPRLDGAGRGPRDPGVRARGALTRRGGRPVKVLLRNPRREIEVPGPTTVVRPARAPRPEPRVGPGDRGRRARHPRRPPRRRRRASRSAPSSRGGVRVDDPQWHAMKCRVCREPAVIDVRRHNANFCHDALRARTARSRSAARSSTST